MSADPSIDDDNKQKQEEKEKDDLNLPEDLTQTTPQQQRQCMKNVGLKSPNVGDYWYPIDKKWYNSWERYTMFNKGNDDIPGGIENLHKIGEPRPGKIDNAALQDSENPKALKRDIQENRTHIWLHQDVWKLLCSWYGGGPEFPRKVFERGNRYNKEKYICIYPQLVELIYCNDKTGEININNDNKKIEQFPPGCTLKQIMKNINYDSKDDDNDAEDNIHIWLKFGDVKSMYPIDSKVKLTAKQLEKEDMNRYVEVPNDYLKTKLDDITDIKEDFVVVIEKKNADGWPRAKGDNWRETLATGDIIDVQDKGRKWYESLIRYVYPSDDTENGGKCIVHYIGWAIKWDEIIEISNAKRLAARNEHSATAYRTRGYSYRTGIYSGYRQNETGTPDQHGVIGLCNLGNTCFMNSTIQCLAQSPQLTNYFLQNDYIHHINVNNPLGWQGRVAKAWSSLLNDMFSGKYRVIAPREFKSVIGEIAPRFMGYSQQDSQELLSFLLDGLHEDLNQIEEKPATPAVESNGRPDHIVALDAWKTYLRRNQSVIVDLLQAQYRSRIDCPDCGQTSVTFDPYMFLSVPLPTQKHKIIQYTWINCDELEDKLPVIYGEKMLKIADIGMLLDKIAKKFNVNKNDMFVCDVWRSKIHRQLKNYDSVGNINNKSDDIFIYYCKKPVNENENKNNENDNKNNDNKNNDNDNDNNNDNDSDNDNYGFETFIILNQNRNDAFGYPLLITLEKNVKMTVGEIGKQLFNLIKPFLENKDLKIDSDELPFKIYATWGYNYYVNNNEKIQIKMDSDEIFDFTNKNNLKFLINWKNIKEYKMLKRLKDASLKSDSDENSDAYGRNNMRHQPIELSACINAFCEKETLSENDAWYCNKCKGFKCASKKIDLWNSPDLLIIHLKRFCYTSVWRDRIDTLVKFPIEGLNLNPFLLCNDDKNDSIYDLYAVSNHMGGMGGGHYTAYAKNLYNKEWYHLNDSGTSKVNNNQSIQSSNAYVLYYYKRKPRKMKHRASRVILPEIKDDK